MKFTICPECKEIIADDELRGSSNICQACTCRKDRSDLIEIDTEYPDESIPQSESKPTGNAPSIPNGEPFDPNDTPYDPNGFAGQAFSTLLNSPEFASKLDKVPSFMQGMVEKALTGMKNQITPIPICHSLDELSLISDAHWENDANIRDMGYLRTLIVKQPGAIAELLFGMGLIGMSLLFFSVALEESILGALLALLLLGGLGVWTLYSGIMTYAKVWIRVFQNRLEIRRGFRKNGQYKVYRRSFMDTSVNVKTDGKPNQSNYYLTIQDNNEYNGRKYTLASGLPHEYLTKYRRMLETILKAEL